MDFRAAISARAELLHALAGPGSAAARYLHRLADAPHLGWYCRWGSVCSAFAADLDRAVVGLYCLR